MASLQLLVVIVISIAVFVTCENDIETKYREVLLQGNVELQWGFNDKKVKFTVTAKTSGWVGLGLSTTPSMNGADIAFMWIKDGKPTVLDMFSTANTLPVIDEQQDYQLVSGQEENGITTFTITRDIETCDSKDITLKEESLRVIWAYGANIPDGDEPIATNYHGHENRGAKSLRILNPRPDGIETQAIQSDPSVLSFDVLPIDLRVPVQTTYYHCQLFKMPEFSTKHHIIEFAPVLTPGNERNVHHIIIHQCSPMIENVEMTSGDCGVLRSVLRRSGMYCHVPMLGYGIGMTKVTYPPNVGMPVGEPGTGKYVMLETHYDNPKLEALIDSSGSRVYYTSKLRPIDSGVSVISAFIASSPLAIPPGSKKFSVNGHCLKECLNEAFSSSNTDEITIFAGMLHGHKTAKSIALKHVRDGVELEPILKESYYDTYYEDIQFLAKPITLKSGDNIILQCDYNTEDRQNFTFGGLTIDDEMCSSYIGYYPRMNIAACGSSMNHHAYFELLKARNSSELLANLHQMSWTEENTREINQKILNAPINTICTRLDSSQIFNFSQNFSPPKITKVYSQEEPRCGAFSVLQHKMSLATMMQLFSSTLCLALLWSKIN